MSPLLALLADPCCPPARAQALAAALGLPLYDGHHPPALLLRLTPERLELCRMGDPALSGAVWADFTTPAVRRRMLQPGRELLVRAAKVRRIAHPLAIDATAGLGRDGFLLAAAGFRVQMYERHPVIAALLEDGLNRARQAEATRAIACRIELIRADVRAALPQLPEQPEVIYLDPMFPKRSKSAKVKLDLQLLQLLADEEDDPEELLRAALAAHARKVVVKRPLKGPWLLGLAPSATFRGKAVRFDLYTGEREGAQG